MGLTFADAARVLRAGGVAVIPTDTVYGIAVVAARPGATQQLFDLKGRGRDVPIAVLVADEDQAFALAADPVPPRARDLAGRHWPGALTIVVERDPAWPGDVGDASTVGLRCPAHPDVRDLCRAVGPLATTSANHHGEPTAVTAAAAAAAFPTVVAVIDGGVLDGSASTVVDCRADPPVILRAGAIPEAEVLR